MKKISIFFISILVLTLINVVSPSQANATVTVSPYIIAPIDGGGG